MNFEVGHKLKYNGITLMAEKLLKKVSAYTPITLVWLVIKLYRGSIIGSWDIKNGSILSRVAFLSHSLGLTWCFQNWLLLNCILFLKRGKGLKWQYLVNIVVASPGECCAWSETAAQAMVPNGNSVMCKDEHTLHTFIPSIKQCKRVRTL